jgi:iron-sulfur cluster assembly accessory protein
MDTQINPVAIADAVTTKPLISLTPIAADKFQALFAEKKLVGYGLRVFVSGGGCSGVQYGMAFENKTEDGDFVFESQGVRVYLDSASAMYLDGATVDYVDSPMGGGFKIENPNATSTCGCGEGGCSCGH